MTSELKRVKPVNFHTEFGMRNVVSYWVCLKLIELGYWISNEDAYKLWTNYSEVNDSACIPILISRSVDNANPNNPAVIEVPYVDGLAGKIYLSDILKAIVLDKDKEWTEEVPESVFKYLVYYIIDGKFHTSVYIELSTNQLYCYLDKIKEYIDSLHEEDLTILSFTYLGYGKSNQPNNELVFN
jgi:hypothetical protein